MSHGRRPGTVQQLTRATEIAVTLSAGGFGWLVDAAGLGPYTSLVRRVRRGGAPGRPAGQSGREQPLPVRLRLALEDLGPTFVKAGQLLAVRSDHLPPAYAEELRHLQAGVSPFPSRESRRIVEEELRRPLDVLFSEFEEEPFAAASLSQVHRARLPDGRRVAVKVQRPGVAEQFAGDLALLAVLARQVQRRAPRPLSFQPTEAVEEIARWSRRELDFRAEARTAQAVGRMFADEPDVVVPEVHWDRTSRRVLTSELIEGVRPAAAAQLAAVGIDAERVITTGTHAMLRQVFRFGVFHADPHAGNLLLLPGNRVAFLDFGLFGRLNRHARRRIGLVLWALLEHDYDAVPDQLLRLAELRPGADVRGFRHALAELVEDWFSDDDRVSMPRLLLQALGVGSRYGVVFATDLMLLARALISLESTVAQMTPDTSLPDLLRPALPELRRALLPSPETLRAAWAENRYDYLGVALDLPDLVADLVPDLVQRTSAVPFPAAPVEPRRGQGLAAVLAASAAGMALGHALGRRSR